MNAFEPNITIEVPSEQTLIVEMKNVSKTFQSRSGAETVLKNFNLTIADEAGGEFVAVLGPSGCGKSTIMNLIGGLSRPTEGEVFSMGEPIVGDNPHSVTVQQAYTCLPWRTVRQNVEFGLEIQGKSPAERKQMAQEYLDKVGLGDRADAYPKELSGGMQQRVVIARCLATKPRIVLMDEPFGALDAKIRADMQSLLLNLWEAEKNCIIFITHDITEALLLADRLIVVSGRPANIVCDMKIPFARPRVGDHAAVKSLSTSPDFLRLSQNILDLLKGQGDGGQVRVSL